MGIIQFMEFKINDLIPQRAPFQLIDEVKEAHDNTIVTGLTISEKHVLVKNTMVSEAALVENIAQSAAALSGVQMQLEQNENSSPKVGVIGSVDRLKILKVLKAPAVLTTRVERTMDFGSFSVVHGEVYCEDELIASCDMKIFIHEK